jgi:GH15 family glucan-1,4-alpha-glucosidase
VRIDGYLPIADYGAIGNLSTIALVGRDGSIDWCCLPAFDSPSVFGGLLDAGRGGRFLVAPAGGGRGEQRYLHATNVLVTTFEARDGTLSVTDFMPLGGDLDGRVEPPSGPEIHRVLTAEGGPLEVEVEWAPRPGYARSDVTIERDGAGFVAVAGDERFWLRGLTDGGEIVDTGSGPVVRARLRVEPAVPLTLATGLGTPDAGYPAERMPTLEETIEAWRRWALKEKARDRAWAEPYGELVLRSELALKLLSYGPTGAIVAAGTTSLPEEVGGQRNYDYRYAWIRDASLTVQALHAMGHGAEAKAFVEWAEHVAEAQGDGSTEVRIMYGIRGETELEEGELEHLEGYRHSRPVLVGNKAAEQRQLDILGELLDGAYELVREGHELPDDIRDFLVSLADDACDAIGLPDDGIWEMRNGPRTYTYSQVMLWVALDRAIQLADAGILPTDHSASWRAARERAKDLVLERGWNEETGAFVQAFDSPELDASSLLFAIHELLPFDDRRVQATIDRTIEHLEEEGLVYRYRMDDGMPGEEGAFVLCSFWLVDALALSGRLDEARVRFERLAARANHVGLFSEQIDPRSGAFLGNFPQAFSHLGLINSAIYLAHAEGRETPVPAPVGSVEHREAVRRDAPRSGDDGDGAREGS